MDRSGAITTLAGTGVAGFSGDGGPAAAGAIVVSLWRGCRHYSGTFISPTWATRACGAWGSTATSRPSREAARSTQAPRMRECPACLCVCWRRAIFWRTTNSIFISPISPGIGCSGSRQTVCSRRSRAPARPDIWATAARRLRRSLTFPAGLAMGFDGSLYIADSSNHAVRRISSGVITTFASAGTPVGLALDVLATCVCGRCGDGHGAAISAQRRVAASEYFRQRCGARAGLESLFCGKRRRYCAAHPALRRPHAWPLAERTLRAEMAERPPWRC